MMLGERQEQFSLMMAHLIIFAYSKGYKVRTGDVWAREEEGAHIKNSMHYHKLAVDINLFKDGEYLTKTSDHQELGEYWELIGGVWGGRFSRPDGNHYEAAGGPP